MRYELRYQERTNWCFPACLQAVFNLRGFNLTQEEIARNLLIQENLGYFASQETLNPFLRKYGLTSKVIEPRTHFAGDLDLIEDSLANREDVIAMGSGLNRNTLSHYVLVDRIELFEIFILDPDVSTREIRLGIDSFLSSTKKGCYVIVNHNNL